MINVKRSAYTLIFSGCLAALSGYAQVSTINSVIIQQRVFNDIPTATFVGLNGYPAFVSFSETGVSATNGFANRDVWRFSADGTTAYAFNNDDFFHASMTVQVTNAPNTPRKEAGFLLATIGGEGQFMVNSDAHEIVAFGGPLPFYAFPATYDVGETITLALTYFRNATDGKRYIIYSADGVDSPPLEFTNLEQGIITGSTLGAYLQVVNDPANANNSATATFGNITISTNLPPTLTCPPEGQFVCGDTSLLTTTVADPDADALTVVWAVNGVIAQTNAVAATNGQTALSFPVALLPAGSNIVTVVAIDAANNTASCDTLIVVTDTTPPVITAAEATPNSLWPPNHKFVNVKLNVAVTDECSATTWKIISVASSEPVLGPGKFAPDWVISGDQGLKLRAERTGKAKPGRVYYVTVQAMDESGNTSDPRTLEVVVPHDMAKKAKAPKPVDPKKSKPTKQKK